MAKSPPHRLGQIIGQLLEEILEERLREFVRGGNLFLDQKGVRTPVRSGRKVSWKDKYGNSHDLDFVIEKGGSRSVQGRPVAFIEAAWRRYTKHSKNKAQEIQGAILPIAELHYQDKPFLGAVLGGEFTKPSLDQLQSTGFDVLYLPYESLMKAFDSVGINARFDESTADADSRVCVERIEKLNPDKRSLLKSQLIEIDKAAIEKFFVALKDKLARQIDRIIIVPLFGDSHEFESVDAAVKFILDLNMAIAQTTFQKFQVNVVFSNGDKIEGVFSEKKSAIKFVEFVST